MKINYKNLAIYFSIFFYLLGIFLLVLLPELVYINIGIIVISILFTIISVFLSRNEILNFMHTKFAKNIAMALSEIFLVFCILSLLNYLIYKNSVILDLGKRKLNTLSVEGEEVLSSVKEEMVFTIFSDKRVKNEIENILNIYKIKNKKIKINYINVQKRPDLIEKYNIIRSPSVRLHNPINNRLVIITKFSELEITNAIIRMGRKRDPILCFLKTNKMLDISENGFSGLLTLLKSQAVVVKMVDILQVENIPSKCDLLSIWGYHFELSKENINKIEEYIKNGGRVLSTFSPIFKKDYFKKRRDLFSKLGLDINNNIVIDKVNFVNGSKGTIPIIDTFDSRGINEKIGQIFFPLSSGVVGNGKRQILPLAYSSKSSWMESNVLEVLAESISFDEKDIAGPIPISSAILEDDRPKIIVIGNSSFVLNKYLPYKSNFSFILNIIHWALTKDNIISLQSNVIEERPLFINDLQKKVIFYFTIFIIPFSLIFLSIIMFKRRRDN